ncbi:NADH-dependent [FeFe] hydrogenase, group A6 [Lawsonibacter faecis]|uniref:Iron hydrogenase small subunit n=1 Tax=Lawsonibacter faecis TaxID=2763052 RepID=A0A8J6M7T5_9FIRM|nr:MULTISPECIES: NADH-dependent [FeFe] hydrogenase, group A6 [Oscillospiraceae]MTQ97008.1 ferredoxin [Pseudoflavonifractor sp. BIOML-A16]MTR06170.1 ferredoxin [Pseudoflavonifractor sp. BIOML-A15]MTR32754.1 ferredoxin [Pseudoflavonifractor sp. BIOML-A14]MTR72862.1 ferredoxin [Pseudoflavonifractor sp. BIOML-A18]MTS63237.1 ferredoxin [Pseudoflavonifractor sp. BIOML-A5]MTS70954.1 ferredoxin [Pseudoflavonifractor sp. BIOML-A8]MTS91976.1 ferredoxin [Pseudoflavonifractor sp. BIOML-A4]
MEQKMVNLTINGLPVSVSAGTTVLEAARSAGIKIPSLCFLKDANEIGACRICVVEVKGAKSLVASCVYPVSEGMEVFTNTEKVRKSRQLTLELILSNHRMDCLTCARSGKCELQQLAAELGIDAVRFAADSLPPQIEDSAAHLVRDNSKCVLCRRCTAVCRKAQEVGVIGCNDRGFDTHIGCAFDRDLAEVDCVSCGQCIVACPTGALQEKDDTDKVWAALADPAKHVVVGPAPSVRVTLGECFGMPVGTNVEGKMVTALKRLGFDKVFDVDNAADFTIMEEGTEFLSRLQNGGALPMITSCSPGWIRYCEQHHPDMLDNLSTCKSPQQMFGSLVKTYYAEKMGIDPKDIFVVSIMPCTAKKYEVAREEMRQHGWLPVDVSLTTRELGRMITRAGLLFDHLPDGEFDEMLGLSTGASVIFGATGGVMEAALRTVVEVVTNGEMKPLEFTEVRGTEGIKEASYELPGRTVRVCVCSGLSNAKKVLDGVKAGELHYDFIEIMACPGGCVNGGGQPIQHADVRNWVDLKALRAKALYTQDEGMTLRKSHENPILQQVYREYLGEPGGHKAHEILHTHYIPQQRYRTE